MTVLDLEFVAVSVKQRLPVEAGGDERGPVERLLDKFIGHLEKEQIGELLNIVLVAQPIVTEDVAVVPELGNEDRSRTHRLGLRERCCLEPSAVRATPMRSRRSAADSSAGSLGTRRPWNARESIARRSRSLR